MRKNYLIYPTHISFFLEYTLKRQFSWLEMNEVFSFKLITGSYIKYALKRPYKDRKDNFLVLLRSY